MGPLIALKFEDRVFVPLTPLPDLQEGDTFEFLLPDPNTVYLCKTDKLAALESGRVIWSEQDADGVHAADD